MKNLKVDLAHTSYKIIIGSGSFERLPAIMKSLKFNGPVIAITDKTAYSKAGAKIKPFFKAFSNDLSSIFVPGNERSKSISVYTDVIRSISNKSKSHKPLILAIGGGVVGDLSGFAAATFRRGVPFIQVPTTLLAQVDSSVGGKVGVDLPEAKNLIGAFKQPEAVIVDPAFLNTLPKRQIRNGIAEIIKYAVIESPTLFKYLEQHMGDLLALKGKVLEKVIFECLKIKARMVEKDERDTKDIRIALNFGHTLGHAIEAASEYSGMYNHGESIAVGMLLAGEMSMRLDMLKEKEFDRIKALIKKAGLPLTVKGISFKKIMESHLYDKKFIAGSNRFVLLTRIGAAEVIEAIPELLIKNVLKGYVR